MLRKGRARKLTVFLNEAARWHGRPLYRAIIDVLWENGLAGGTVVRAMAGFTRGAGIVTGKILRLSEDLPLKVEVVDTVEAIDRVIPDLYLMLEQGLITVEDVEVVKYTGGHTQPDRPAPTRKVTMQARQLWVYLSENDLYHGEPLYEAILKRFNAEEFAGATVFKGLEGFGAHHQIHRDRLLTLHREAPIALVMVDTTANIESACAILDGMLERGVVVVGDVQATFYRPAAEGLATAPEEPAD